MKAEKEFPTGAVGGGLCKDPKGRSITEQLETRETSYMVRGHGKQEMGGGEDGKMASW